MMLRGSIGHVDELFAPPGNEWQPVSPRLATMRRLVLLVLGLVVTALVAVLLAVATSALATVGWVVLAALLLAWSFLMIGRNARSWAYAERDEDLYIKHGVLFRRLVSVPYGRMQYVDVQAGPLDQAFKIANVHLHTASPSTTARIPGLNAEEAARLRDRLTSLGEAQAAGL